MSGEVRPTAAYTNEQRIAVVMYGGVSLAIYIGGVATELLSLVRASAPAPDDGSRTKKAALAATDLVGTEGIYRKIAQWTPNSGKSPLESSPSADLKTRFVIDVVSGTSAGGINGVFLSRALAENRTLDAISNLWIQEGDFGKLLNDSKSIKDINGLPLQNPPVALLNGERMFHKLLGAFGAMAPGKSTIDAGERIDLYVTTTDVRGEFVRIPLANGFATEKRYRQAFHFVYEPDAKRNDFIDENKARLAFAARCTSSFPFAFEPFTWSDAARLAGVKDDSWTDHLLYHSGDYAKRPLCDGGYLDNKPFSYVVGEMAKRHSDLPSARTLFYVEPDPEVLDEHSLESLQETKPNAINNAVSALISLPGYETIREDIERVIDRNKRVDLLQKLIEKIDEHLADPQHVVPRGEMRKAHGVAYVAYHQIKVASVMDWFSDLVCTSAKLGEARLEQVANELVALWVDEAYRKGEGDDQLLLDLDFAYRMRKLAFLLRRCNDPNIRTLLKDIHDDCYRLQRKAREAIGDGARRLFASRRSALETVANACDTNEHDQLIAVLFDSLHICGSDEEKKARKEKAIQELTAAYAMTNPIAREAELDRLFASAPLDMLANYIETDMRDSMHKISRRLQEVLKSPAAEHLPTDEHLFEQYDMVLFPLMREGGVGEPVHVDVVRISPLDVKSVGKGPNKLLGSKLGHFGAFLEEDWRRNDILWGRLDGAEMLIRQMMVMEQDKTIVDDVVAKAHEIIIDDLCVELRKRLTENQTAKASSLTPTPQQQRQSAAAQVVCAKLDDKGAMVDYFSTGNGFDTDFDRARQADNAARAGRIVEKIFSGIAQEQKKTLPRVIGSVLTFVWGLVQISIPQSLPRLLWSHIAQLAFLVFAALTVGGYLGDSTAIMKIGIKGAVMVVGISVVSSLIADWFRERLKLHWLSAVQALGLFLLFAAALLASVTIWREAALSFTITRALAAWLTTLEKAVPRAVIYAIEATLFIVATGVVRGAGRAKPA